MNKKLKMEAIPLMDFLAQVLLEVSERSKKASEHVKKGNNPGVLSELKSIEKLLAQASGIALFDSKCWEKKDE